MTEAEILRKAIEKAMTNGYATALVWDEERNTLCEAGGVPGKYQPVCANSIIFDHEFAKAFWGEEIITVGYRDKNSTLNNTKLTAHIEYTYPEIEWRWRLQQMVLEKNPVRYIERFI